MLGVTNTSQFSGMSPVATSLITLIPLLACYGAAAQRLMRWRHNGVSPTRGVSSSRAKIYSSVLYAMLTGQLASWSMDLFIRIANYLEPRKYVPLGITWR